MALVFLEDWQHECCGEPFAVGDGVTWPLTSDLGHEQLASVLGSDLSGRLTAAVERHSEHAVPTRLRINAVRSAFCEYEPDPDAADDRTIRAVPGTAVLRPVEQVDRRSESMPGLQWVGYVVDADVLA